MAKLTNAQRQAAYRARKKAEKAKLSGIVGAATTGDVVPDPSLVASPVAGVDEDTLRVDVKVDDRPAPKLSLKDRLLQKVQGNQEATPAPKQKSRGRSKKEDDNLLLTVAPTVLASLIATYSQQILPDEYKPCAPTREEVSGVIGPLMAILARRVEIVGKASQDAIDLMNSLICGFMYGTRAYITYVDIKKSQEGSASGNNGQREEHRYAFNGSSQTARSGSYQDSINGLGRHVTSVPTSTTYEYAAEDHALFSNAAPGEGDTARRDREAEAVAELFARDKRGRTELGLLPRAV